MKFKDLVNESAGNFYATEEPREFLDSDGDKVFYFLDKIYQDDLEYDPNGGSFQPDTAWESNGKYYIYFSLGDYEIYGEYELIYDGKSVKLNINLERTLSASFEKPGKKLQKIIAQKQNEAIKLFKSVFKIR